MNVEPASGMNLGRSSASIARALRQQPRVSSAGLGWRNVEMFHWTIDTDRHAYETYDDVLLSYHVTNGVEIDLTVNGRRRDYRSQHGLLVVVVPGGSAVAFEADNRFDCWNIHLSRACFPERRSGSGSSLTRDFCHLNADQHLTGLIAVLSKEMRDPSQQGSLLAEHLSAAIAYYLEFRLPGAPAAAQPSALSDGALRQAMELIESRIEQGVSLADLAAVAGLSASQFSRNFRKTLGVSPHAYLQSRRIELAEFLLGNTNRGICEIALLCGFSSQSHFTEAFRHAKGLPPRQYRLANH